ncbi:MAG: 4-hydroxy-3-methylbut-2-en-1-yl diphosphate synthase, partial [Rhodocyclaceae bacterium]|nr:4-hydroxy-3-methylbut-2-en-1-yl diphosphate synthase [Rhodocyclaceae bacterium]
GISLPGTGEEPVAPVYADGARITTLRGENIAAEFRSIIENYVERSYPLLAES